MNNQPQSTTQALLHFLARFAATSMVVKSVVSENLTHAGEPGALGFKLHSLIRTEVVAKSNVPDATFLFAAGEINSTLVSQLLEIQASHFPSAKELEEAMEGLRQEAVDKLVTVVEKAIERLSSQQ